MIEKKNMSKNDHDVMITSVWDSLMSIDIKVKDNDKVETCSRGLGT